MINIDKQVTWILKIDDICLKPNEIYSNLHEITAYFKQNRMSIWYTNFYDELERQDTVIINDIPFSGNDLIDFIYV